MKLKITRNKTKKNKIIYEKQKIGEIEQKIGQEKQKKIGEIVEIEDRIGEIDDRIGEIEEDRRNRRRQEKQKIGEKYTTQIDRRENRSKGEYNDK